MDETTRLCEECGYIVEGLPPAAVCPECGAAVPRSRDERRPGSAWQRAPGVGAWVRTTWASLRRPGPMFSHVRIDPRSARNLLRINVGVSSALLAMAAVRVLGLDKFPPSRSEAAMGAAVLTAGSVLGAALLLVLTAIEARGIRFFGARRGWRITRAVAATICAHASVGWVIGAALVLGVSAYFPVQWSPRAGFWQRFFFVQWIPGAMAAFFLGLLVFECLVYVGVRRCRFANTPDPVRAAGLAPVETEPRGGTSAAARP